ncbi:cytosolic acyl coenzyme A thioester hydrolase [Octodon degus]|uniref:Cytosolic acyl coenzyme A thioester hydrolase n=1 Tax=Octodon degus TaxID=10160 RepID=A0A6P3F6F8_OCTDE|nr:cytosolic acyl coenzyme A thioester hydrolase [Octodon degus]
MLSSSCLPAVCKPVCPFCCCSEVVRAALEHSPGHEPVLRHGGLRVITACIPPTAGLSHFFEAETEYPIPAMQLALGQKQDGLERCVAALARVERTDFLSPMCIGEVAHVSAEITYTSKHSVEVQVNVMSENILTGAKKLTNKATLWYVPLSLKNVDKVLEVPPVVYSRQEQEEEGRKRYEAQKLERMGTKWRNGDVVQPVLNPEPNTVSYSQSSLIHLVGPSDCTLHGFVHGGVTMKLMDEVAGIVAARHCKTNIVTASVDAINFHDKIRKGCVITISGRMTFTSNKSMEIEVLVDADPVVGSSQKRYRAASAFFTYVSLSQEGRPLPVPQLVPETEDEKKRFEEGKGRYLQMKAKRQGQAEPQP